MVIIDDGHRVPPSPAPQKVLHRIRPWTTAARSTSSPRRTIRVSSAAKLRRWAMDSAGNFYAAMEIKSIEAKLRAADPSAGV